MSTPFRGHENPIRGVISEALGATSALHMVPDPLPAPEEGWGKGPAFLAYTDKWAAHACEHIHAVVDEANRIDTWQQSLTWLVSSMSRNGEIDEAAYEKLWQAVTTFPEAENRRNAHEQP